MSYPPVTPNPKSVPGNFFQTPAASNTNGPLFSSTQFTPRATNAAGATLQPTTAQPKPTTNTDSKTKAETISPRERAARTIDEALLQEARYPDLDNYLSQGFSSDYDIPTSTSWAPFQKVKMYKIPDQIFDQYNRAQVSTSMGLFAELNHAWVTIDNALYMWDYTHPNPQLVGFEDQPNSINAVKLARPRKGVFLPSVTHLLVVSTTAEIFLLGLGCETVGGATTVSLYQTGMFVHIKGLDVHAIGSSDSTGRIFFSSTTDNDVHELTYQQEERWFQGKCGKVNHTNQNFSLFSSSFALKQPTEHVEQMVVDDTRNLLYTLSSNSSIRVFHLKPNGSLDLTITKQAIDIYSNLGHIISSNETLNRNIKIVAISPIPAAEASRYHLVATTATGYRIYLSAHGSYSWSANSSAANAPTSMQAQHIITPPSDTPPAMFNQQLPMAGGQFPNSSAVSSPIHSLNPTSSAQRFPPGYFFCFTQKDPTKRTDSLFISTPDSGRLAKPQDTPIPLKPSEVGFWLPLGSRAEDIGLSTPSDISSRPTAGFGNELSIQFDQPAVEIAVLTNTGVHVIRRRRLVDIFASLIRNSDDAEEGLESQVKVFIRLYGRSETLATALAVACGQGLDLSSDTRLSRINDPDVLEFARKVFIEFGGKPTLNENAVTDGSSVAIDAVAPSPRHAGIALYTSRLLRSIWKTVIVNQGRSPSGGLTVSPSVSVQSLQAIQRDLSALQEFFRANRTFIEGLSGPEALTRVATKQEEIALQAEHRALHSLVQLISHTIEGISFILVLFENRVEEIITLLTEDAKTKFLELTFEQLFASSKGQDIAKELVKAIVNQNITRGSNVETVAEALRRKCGSFCSSDDVLIFKGQELLKRATESGPNSEYGRNLLNESLILLKQVSENFPMDYLQITVDQYIQNQFFAGAIQLALSVAADSDRANHALSWIMDGRPSDDPRQSSFDLRNQCYDLIYKVVLAIDEPSFQSQASADGSHSIVAKRRNEAYEVISNSKDEVFLTSLYDWYLARGLSDRLLEIRTPFVATYLQRRSAEDIFHADLLWRYHMQSNQFYNAATVQFELAKSSFQLSLSRRIEYLSQARANASIATPDVPRASRQRLQQEVALYLDISHVQDDLLQRLKDETRIEPDRKAAVLDEVNGGVMELSMLYNTYAEPGDYYDICLQIMYIAGHRNASDIQTNWQNLIQRVHEEASQRESPLPYEAVIEKVRTLAHRLRMSSVTFPVRTLLPMLERYRVENQQHDASTWVVDLFLELQVEHEMIYTVLESLFYNDEVPFQGSNRKYIGHDLTYLISRWLNDTVRIGGGAFGSEVLASRISEMLLLLQQAGLDNEVIHACRDMRVRIEQSLN